MRHVGARRRPSGGSSVAKLKAVVVTGERERMPKALPSVTSRMRLRATTEGEREALRRIEAGRLVWMAARTIQPVGVDVSEFLHAHGFVWFDQVAAPAKLEHLSLFPGEPHGAHLE